LVVYFFHIRAWLATLLLMEIDEWGKAALLMLDDLGKSREEM
jgi:hypothetical protein